MTDWVGFTDAELNKIKSNKPQASKTEDGPKIVKPVARKTFDPSAKNKQSAANRKQIKKNIQTRNKGDDVPSSALLSKPKKAPPATLPNTNKSNGNQSASTTSVNSKGDSATHPNSEPLKPVEKAVQQTNNAETVQKQPPEEKKQPELITDDETVQEKQKQTLEDVHRRHQEMEERNKRKKTMLSKEIALRKRKALAESSKLHKVQQELAKLDQLLSFDVSILRDKIDEACFEYNSAKKRFEQAEAEYVASKIDLHRKTTLKEDLTEHLYHLIEANEERKSKKLEELMLALDVEEDELLSKEPPPETVNKDASTSADASVKPAPTPVEESPEQKTASNVTTTEISATSTESLHGADATNTET